MALRISHNYFHLYIDKNCSDKIDNITYLTVKYLYVWSNKYERITILWLNWARNIVCCLYLISLGLMKCLGLNCAHYYQRECKSETTYFEIISLAKSSIVSIHISNFQYVWEKFSNLKYHELFHKFIRKEIIWKYIYSKCMIVYVSFMWERNNEHVRVKYTFNHKLLVEHIHLPSDLIRLPRRKQQH